MERFVNTDDFNYVFRVNGSEIGIMITRNPELNTINGTRIDNIEFSDTDIMVERNYGYFGIELTEEERRFSLSRIRMQWICTSEAGGPCNSAYVTQMTSSIIFIALFAVLY